MVGYLLALVVGVHPALAQPIDEAPRHGLGAEEGWPRLLWQQAETAVGRQAVVFGQVARVGHTERIHFLNFDPERRDVFHVVIFSEALPRFDQSLEELFQDRWIAVRGWVTTFRGVPQIQVARREQIEVLAGPPADVSTAIGESTPRSAAPALRGDELTLATFNIRNLFDGYDDPYRADENTPEKPRSELAGVAGVLIEIDADVVALQEVENEGILTRFVQTYLPRQGYEHIVLVEGNDLRGIDVALLSRFPVGRVVSHRQRSFDNQEGSARVFHRDVLQVELLPAEGDPLEVWVVHLKSNSDGRAFAEPIRLAEAQALRRLLEDRLAADPRAQLVVCGDFNDLAESPTVTTVSGGEPAALASDWENLNQANRVTYNLEPYREMIDFIFWSPAMRDRYVPGSYRVRLGELAESGSDHNPVIARFRFRH